MVSKTRSFIRPAMLRSSSRCSCRTALRTWETPLGSIAGTGLPYVVRSSTAIPGRWGEAQSIPGSQFINPLNPTARAGSAAFVNVVGDRTYGNPVRAGYSINIRDILSGLPPDAADDNFNTYDPYPMRRFPWARLPYPTGREL